MSTSYREHCASRQNSSLRHIILKVQTRKRKQLNFKSLSSESEAQNLKLKMEPARNEPAGRNSVGTYSDSLTGLGTCRLQGIVRLK